MAVALRMAGALALLALLGCAQAAARQCVYPSEGSVDNATAALSDEVPLWSPCEQICHGSAARTCSLGC
eukprot:SAG31_NODE_43757_length_265_cov_1.560241_1_plen_68_part_01